MEQNANLPDAMPVSRDWPGLLERSAQWLLLLAVMCLGVFVAWTFGRGLELTDEAFYVLTSMHPESLRFFFTPTHWISGPLWQVTQGLAAFRATGWVLLTGATVVFALGATRVASLTGLGTPVGGLGRWAVVIATVAGAWLYGSILNFSPSYNLLAAAGAYASLGMSFLSLGRATKRSGILFAGIAGIMLGLTMLSKFTTGICTAGLMAGLHLVDCRQRGVRALNAVAMGVTLAATLAAFIVLESSVHAAYEAFHVGLALTNIAQHDESVLTRLSRNWTECSVLLKAVASMFGRPLICIAIAVLARSTTVGIVAAAWMVWVLVTGDSLVGGMDAYQLQSQPLVAITCAMLLLTIRQWGRRLEYLALVLVLVGLPFTIAIGTGNPIPFQIDMALASWGTLCAMLAFIASGSALRPPAILLCLIFVATVASQIVTSAWRAPYRLAHPVQDQTVRVELKGFGALKVDGETQQLVDEVNAAARRCDIRPGTPYLGLYGPPGIAVLLQAVPLDTPWLFDQAFATAVLNGSDPAKLRAAVIGVRLLGDGSRPPLPKQIGDFPRGYRHCGDAVVPFEHERLELWAPEK